MIFSLYLLGQAGALLIGLEQHIQHERQHQQSEDQPDNMHVANNSRADLVDHQRDSIGKDALVGDRERRPFGRVHLAADRTHRRKARRAQQVERQERVAAQRGEHRGDSLIHGAVAAAIEHTHGADDILLRDQSGDRGDSRLPVAPSQGGEQPRDSVADDGEDALRDLVLLQHRERAVREPKA